MLSHCNLCVKKRSILKKGEDGDGVGERGNVGDRERERTGREGVIESDGEGNRIVAPLEYWLCLQEALLLGLVQPFKAKDVACASLSIPLVHSQLSYIAHRLNGFHTS